MLQIVPMAEKTEEAALLAKTEGAPDNGRVLVMTDSEETLGYVVVALEDDTLVFYGFSVSGQTDFTKAKPDPMNTYALRRVVWRDERHESYPHRVPGFF